MSVTQQTKVLHVKNVTEDARTELMTFAAQFGEVKNLCFLSKFNQALLELDSLRSAAALLSATGPRGAVLRGRTATFAYSHSQQINTPPSFVRRPVQVQVQECQGPALLLPPARVLLCSVNNPTFPITADVINQVMSRYGQVLRVVVFHKTGVQALVEFSDSAGAAAAKAELDGKDIYPNSCTLRIEWSRTDKVNVRYNTDLTKDFTNQSLPNVPPSPPPFQAVMPLAQMDPFSAEGCRQMMLSQGMPVGGQMVMGSPMSMVPPAMPMVPMNPQQQQQQQPTSVVMVFNLPDRISCDNVFNMFSQFGSVMRVKILPSLSPGLQVVAGMVQMDSADSALVAITNLNGRVLFGYTIRVLPSKHLSISDGVSTGAKPCKDFSAFPRNANEPIIPVSSKLFWRVPAGDVNTVGEIFGKLGAPASAVLSSTDQVSGFAQFENSDEALMAVMLCHRAAIAGGSLILAFARP